MSAPVAGVRAIAGDIAAGRLSAVEVCRDALDRIARVNPSLNAFNLVTAERALERAADIDRRRAANSPLGPLAGVPLAVKDNLCVRGMRTTASSRILDTFVPPYDATVIAKLEQAGAKVEFKKVEDRPIPEELKNAFKEMPELKTAFKALTPGRQREYIMHFSEAKQSKTRESRIEKAMQKILNGEGLTCCASHVSLPQLRDNPQKVIDDHKLWSCSYIAIGGLNPRNPVTQTWLDFAEEYNAIAKKLEGSGIKLGYHTHSNELAKYDGKVALQILLEHFRPEIWIELDVYWITAGGGDPAQWIGKLKNRV